MNALRRLSSKRTTAAALASVALIATANAHGDCIDDASAYHGVSPSLLHAIAAHESGMRSDAVNRNSNGTEDLGLMQINSSWLSTLAKYGVTRESLFNPCVNAFVGAWILKSNIQRFGPTWAAVGAYNAKTPAKQLRYANQIYAQLLRQGVQANVHR